MSKIGDNIKDMKHEALLLSNVIKCPIQDKWRVMHNHLAYFVQHMAKTVDKHASFRGFSPYKPANKENIKD